VPTNPVVNASNYIYINYIYKSYNLYTSIVSQASFFLSLVSIRSAGNQRLIKCKFVILAGYDYNNIDS